MHQFDYNCDFCASCSKQSNISTCKSKEYINQDCWLTSALLLPPPLPISESYKDPPISLKDDECWEKELLIEMEYWYSTNKNTPSELYIQKSFLRLALFMEGFTN